jgi:nitroimidazol reductase NimA-like FMN-containing flavoprotein (pyridoxamine 5'-phosphate oxidase superfamily)
MSFVSSAVQGVFEQGQFCAVATTTPSGPHCTPLVFAYSGARIWLTTSRGSVKDRAWKADPAVSGLIRHDGLAVAFTGSVRTYDALDRATWSAAVAGATSIARATAGFSRKNAPFFSGSTKDAHKVPLAWVPPGRVFVGIDIERTALLDDAGVQEGRGRWGAEAGAGSHDTFRASRSGHDPLAGLPPEVAPASVHPGDGALTLLGEHGEVVLPVRWGVDGSALYAVLPQEILALAAAEPDAPAALTVAEEGPWRATEMRGAMFQGTASSFLLDGLGRGGRSASSIAEAIAGNTGRVVPTALVRIEPSRIVWWDGWSTGTIEPT